MENSKFSKNNNKDKILNTIIELRKEILTMLRDFSEDLDRELYNSTERSKIRQEVKEIAQMVRDKDKYVEKVELLEELGEKEIPVTDSLIKDTRAKAKVLLKYKRDSIIATQYDSEELQIVEKELEEIKKLIAFKDRIIRNQRTQVADGDKVRKVNPHLSKYFKRLNIPEL